MSIRYSNWARSAGLRAGLIRAQGAPLPLPTILQQGPLPAAAVALLRRRFQLVDVPNADVRGIATSGKVPIGKDLLDRLPALEIVSCLGAGTDGIETGELARRRIAVETTSRVLAADVADVAIGLVVSLARDFRRADRYVRDGGWLSGKYPLGTALGGSRLGILGMGTIGEAVAHRATAFGLTLGYHNRSPKPASQLRYFSSLLELAEWSTFLVLCCPGGADTRHIVNGQVLTALGPKGWLVNVARGSVVDEAALVAALESSTIAGAGLDVFADEPVPHPGLFREDVFLLPHIGSATSQTRDAMAGAMVEALARALNGRSGD